MRNIGLKSKMESEYEWQHWVQYLPYLDFDDNWKVKVIPPFGGAVARFQIKHKENEDAWVSVYLDCYGELGAKKKPYWEVYPYQYEDYEDVFRVMLGDEDELLEKIRESLQQQIKEEK